VIAALLRDVDALRALGLLGSVFAAAIRASISASSFRSAASLACAAARSASLWAFINASDAFAN